MNKPEENRPKGKKRNALLLGILSLCLAVRFYCLLQSSWIQPILDEKEYLQIAHTIVDKGSYPGSFRPPGFPFFMATMLFLGARDLPLATKWVQIALSLFTCVILMGIARRSFDEKTALAAGVVYALYPNLAVISTQVWSETLFITFLISSMALLLRGDASQSRRDLGIAGVLMGLAALTRAVILYFLPLVLYWLWKSPRRSSGWRVKAGIIFFACVALTVLPWTYRNYTVHRQLVLIDTNGGFNFFMGNSPPVATSSVDNMLVPYYMKRYRSFSENESERARISFVKGWQRIRREPGAFAVKFFIQAFYLWTLDSLILKHLRNGWYGKVSLSRIRVTTLLAAGSYLLVTLTAIGGFILAPTGRIKELTLLLIGYYTFVHGVVFALSRYRLPLLPFMMIFSSYFVMEIIRKKGIPKERMFRKKWGVSIVVALLVWGATFPVVLDTWRTGGEGYRFRMVHYSPNEGLPDR